MRNDSRIDLAVIVFASPLGMHEHISINPTHAAESVTRMADSIPQENGLNKSSCDCNICGDENGFVICSGGFLQVVPFPVDPGPWVVTVSNGEIQFVDAAVFKAPPPSS